MGVLWGGQCLVLLLAWYGCIGRRFCVHLLVSLLCVCGGLSVVCIEWIGIPGIGIITDGYYAVSCLRFGVGSVWDGVWYSAVGNEE